MKARWLGIGFVALVAVALSSQADHCDSYTTSDAFLDTCDATGIKPCYYLASALFNGQCPLECRIDLWMYEEANGLDGLQRGGTSLLGETDYVDDTCHGQISPDFLIF